jgi:hypothetical protein
MLMVKMSFGMGTRRINHGVAEVETVPLHVVLGRNNSAFKNSLEQSEIRTSACLGRVVFRGTTQDAAVYVFNLTRCCRYSFVFLTRASLPNMRQYAHHHAIAT